MVTEVKLDMKWKFLFSSTKLHKKHQNRVSVISHCESRALSENSARYDVTLYVAML